MIKDYHMHPTIVQDRERFHAFAGKAIEEGIEEICVTDHMPLSVSNAADRIPAGRVEDYCRTVRELAREYEGRLSVKLGIEIDYHPDYTDEIEAVLKAGDYDYVIGSSHMHVGQVDIFHMVSTRNEYARASLENSLLAAQSGYFDAIAHLDIYRWNFTLPKRFPLVDDDYCYEMHLPLIDRVLDTIRDEGLRLELNPHFAAKELCIERMYPEMGIVQMALDKGLRFSYGSDAHVPQEVGVMLQKLRTHPVYGKAIQRWEGD